jgi:hypothetical protein
MRGEREQYEESERIGGGGEQGGVEVDRRVRGRCGWCKSGKGSKGSRSGEGVGCVFSKGIGGGGGGVCWARPYCVVNIQYTDVLIFNLKMTPFVFFRVFPASCFSLYRFASFRYFTNLAT